MRENLSKILITGGAGFIGSEFVRLLIKMDCPCNSKGLSTQKANPKETKGTVPEVIVVDKLTYAGDLARLKEVEGKYKFYKADICDKSRIDSIFKTEKPDMVVNFAAESHVDRSILDSKAFIETNVLGTQKLLDISKKYRIKKFIHISTDEIYGDIKEGRFSENSALKPNSPYAASKAAGDLLIRAFVRTYNFPAIIVRPCNNYGPWQYPEKLIPLAILKILRNEKVPVYGNGTNVREWLYVQDCAEAIFQILEKGKMGSIYNLSSREEKRNIEVIRLILRILRKDEDLIEFVKDRPGHDFRYSLDCTRIYRLGWRPRHNFTQALELTVKWYLRNISWWQRIGQKRQFKLHYQSWYSGKNS